MEYIYATQSGPAAGLKNSRLHVEADPPTPTSIESSDQGLSFSGLEPAMRLMWAASSTDEPRCFANLFYQACFYNS